VNKPVPKNRQRVVLVNPTKYLGNLLLAGGLMQAYVRYCQDQGIQLKIVIDEGYRGLCENSFPADSLIFFPRRKISQSGLFKKISLYRACLKEIRTFKADIAFNIEEDSASSHLTRLSGASFKLGCSPARHKNGYDAVIPVQFENREPGRRHRWYSYYDVFAALGMPEPEKNYLDLNPGALPDTLTAQLREWGWNPQLKTIAIHAGATKDYKRWPVESMAVLVKEIMAAGFQAVLLGAGSVDENANQEIARQLQKAGVDSLPLDLCNRLSLLALGQFMNTCALMVGNDSGPFHLGSALGLPGLVLFGPTNDEIWGPLGQQSKIVRGDFSCDPACNKGHCLHQHRCMKDISPDYVMEKILLSVQT
jgi:ADP-heptose:LPS heptosyltransferase